MEKLYIDISIMNIITIMLIVLVGTLAIGGLTSAFKAYRAKGAAS